MTLADDALIAGIGLVGVLVGAFASGWMNAILARGQRDRAGLVASRILASVLDTASVRLWSMHKNKAIGDPSENWEAMLIRPWEDHRADLALVVKGAEDFATVAHGFSIIWAAISFRTRLQGRTAEQLKAETPEIDKVLLAYKADVDAAYELLWKLANPNAQAAIEPGVPEGASTVKLDALSPHESGVVEESL